MQERDERGEGTGRVIRRGRGKVVTVDKIMRKTACVDCKRGADGVHTRGTKRKMKNKSTE